MTKRQATAPQEIQGNSAGGHFLWFTLLFLGLCVWYAYPAIFDDAPQSTHAWRQTDGASIAYRYYQDGLHFFQPRILNVLESDGQTLGEFPLIYYLAALLGKLFGYEDGWLRLITLTFLFGGLFALSRLVYHLIGDLAVALFIPFLLFTSPALAFYGFNFLPDAPALGLVFPGALGLYHFYARRHRGWLAAGLFFFLLAGLIKITALVGLIALLGLYLLQAAGPWSKRIELPDRRRVPAGALLVLAGVLIWVVWMKNYKESHDSRYFLATTNPIWAYSAADIAEVLQRIWGGWLKVYFHPVILAGLFGLGLFTVLTPKRQRAVAYALNVLILLGGLAVFALWFYQFHHHDYYIVILLVLPASILTTFFLYLRERRPGLLKNRLFRLSLLALLVLGAFHARREMVFRYSPGNKYMAGLNPSFLKTAELQAFLREHGIQYPDKVLSLPDSSPNMSLYYLRLKGWTNFNEFPDLVDDRGVEWNRATLAHLARLGCKYLVVSDENWVDNPDLKEVQGRPVGVFDGSVHFFDIGYLGGEE